MWAKLSTRSSEPVLFLLHFLLLLHTHTTLHLWQYDILFAGIFSLPIPSHPQFDLLESSCSYFKTYFRPHLPWEAFLALSDSVTPWALFSLKWGHLSIKILLILPGSLSYSFFPLHVCSKDIWALPLNLLIFVSPAVNTVPDKEKAEGTGFHICSLGWVIFNLWGSVSSSVKLW